MFCDSRGLVCFGGFGVLVGFVFCFCVLGCVWLVGFFGIFGLILMFALVVAFACFFVCWLFWV